MQHCNNEAFYLETDFISSENMACHLILGTPTLVVMTAWILFGIVKCTISRFSEFKVHQI